MDYFKSLGIETGKGRYYEEAVYGVALLYHFIDNKIGSYLADFNLTPAKFNVLMVLKHQGGKNGVSQVAISKRLIVTASNMTRLLDKLEKEKLIQKSAQKGDKRVNIIQISQQGSDLLDKAWPGYIEKVKGLAACLSGQEQKVLSILTMRWLKKLAEDENGS